MLSTRLGCCLLYSGRAFLKWLANSRKTPSNTGGGRTLWGKPDSLLQPLPAVHPQQLSLRNHLRSASCPASWSLHQVEECWSSAVTRHERCNPALPKARDSRMRAQNQVTWPPEKHELSWHSGSKFVFRSFTRRKFEAHARSKSPSACRYKDYNIQLQHRCLLSAVGSGGVFISRPQRASSFGAGPVIAQALATSPSQVLPRGW